MNWPPNKAWTSTSLRVGFRHFIAINYGGTDFNRWVLMVSVLDGKSRLRISWEELKDPAKWKSGWEPLPRDEANPPNEVNKESLVNYNKEPCLHPSEDSGLIIPTEINGIRPWFLDNE